MNLGIQHYMSTTSTGTPSGIHPYRIGFDFGGVIMQPGKMCGHPEKASDDPDFLNRPAMPNAFESIKRLVALFGQENVFIVSRCSIEGEQKIMTWLCYHNFWEITGLTRACVRFCRERHEKGPICAELGITHFVDDRLECLIGMDTVLNRYRLSDEPPDIDIATTTAVAGFQMHAPSKGNVQMIFGYKTWSEIDTEVATTMGAL